jgi:7,8-dihydropterin-6-yl-methyl-4-(beta-D-ribofuranosyl)aminobenzene 5'-phosphate synthase
LTEHAVNLRAIDKLELISLIDCSADFGSKVDRKNVQPVRRWVKEFATDQWIEDKIALPFAEHGFSMLIRLFDNEAVTETLFDTGITPTGVVENAKRMGLDLSRVAAIALSHGHYDHFGGMLKTIEKVNKPDLPVFVHEDMFRVRGTINSDGNIRKLPVFPAESQTKPAILVKTKKPQLVANDILLITGEIPRTNQFEKGFQKQLFFSEGKWLPDPWVWDDRALVVNVKEKGLVVLSGCAHAGIINTISYAQQLTGISTVHAVLGGFHLADASAETVTKTVEHLKTLKLMLIAPSHCTGWRAAFLIAQAMPESFVWNSVGNLYTF